MRTERWKGFIGLELFGKPLHQTEHICCRRTPVSWPHPLLTTPPIPFTATHCYCEHSQVAPHHLQGLGRFSSKNTDVPLVQRQFHSAFYVLLCVPRSQQSTDTFETIFYPHLRKAEFSSTLVTIQQRSFCHSSRVWLRQGVLKRCQLTNNLCEQG